MRKNTAKDRKKLEENPYTYKVTEHKLMFTAEFKKDFWRKYEAGQAPRAILTELGYDTDMFGQKQIDSMVQSMKSRQHPACSARARRETIAPAEAGGQTLPKSLRRRKRMSRGSGTSCSTCARRWSC